MKIRKHIQKIPLKDWIKSKRNESKTILVVHIVTIVSVFLVALIIQN